MSPPIVSVCLQAMWSMGTVKEHYLIMKKQITNTSPPYFDFTGVENNSNIEQNLDTLVKEYIPSGDNLK